MPVVVTTLHLLEYTTASFAAFHEVLGWHVYSMMATVAVSPVIIELTIMQAAVMEKRKAEQRRACSCMINEGEGEQGNGGDVSGNEMKKDTFTAQCTTTRVDHPAKSFRQLIEKDLDKIGAARLSTVSDWSPALAILALIVAVLLVDRALDDIGVHRLSTGAVIPEV